MTPRAKPHKLAPTAPWRLWRTAAIALSLMLVPAGCNPKGELTLRLDLPPDESGLNPLLDPRLASITLVVETSAGEEVIRTVAYNHNRGPIEMGDVPLGDVRRIAVIGRSATDQIIAYGEGAGATLSAREVTAIDVALRKPLTYVAGARDVLVFDTSKSGADDEIPAIPAATQGQRTGAVATTPDGRFLLVAADNPVEIAIFETRQHIRIQSVPLRSEPQYLSVSPDGRWAIASNVDNDTISVIDLDLILRQGGNPSSAVTELPINQPSLAAFLTTQGGQEAAVVLSFRLPLDVDCAQAQTPSVLNMVDLGQPPRVFDTVLLEGAARDVAPRPGTNETFVAQTCLGRIGFVDVTTRVQTDILNIQVPTALITHEDTLYVGSADISADGGQTSANVVISAVDTRTLTKTEIRTPFFTEGVPFSSGTGGRTMVLKVRPDAARVYRLSVAPGASRLSALVYATYHSDGFVLTVDAEQWSVPQTDIRSYSYVGLEASSGEVRRRFRGYCEAFFDGNPANTSPCDDLESFEQTSLLSQFIPLGVTTLFGVP